ncbi:Pantothenate synthetase [compost metagenome]
MYRTLSSIADAIKQGDRDYPALIAAQRQQLEAAGLRTDYLEIRHALTLRPATAQDRDLVILVAAFLGTTRLIDNLHLDLDAS